MKQQPSRWVRRLNNYAGTVVVQIGFGLVATYIGLSMLSAEDYGVYAIIAIVTALLAALSVGPVSIISAGSYLNLKKAEKASANAVFVLLTLAIATSASILLYLLWPWIALLVGKPVGQIERYFSCLSIVLQALVGVYMNLNHNHGFSGRVLIITLGQSLTALLAIYAGLYLFRFDAASLYFSQFAGFLTAAVLSIALAEKMARPTRFWVRRWIAESRSYSVNALVTNLPSFVENIMIARFVSLASLAAWQHSKIYHAFIMRAGKVIGLTIWPTALAEAKQGNFRITRVSWRAVYVAYSIMGVGAAFLAEPVIDFLTHGKLLAASVLVPWWVVYNLLQNAGREAEATLYSADLGAQAANAQSCAKIVALVLMIPLLYGLGLMGVLIAALAEVICFRFLLRRKAAAVQPIPAIDYWAFGGSALIIIAIAVEHLLGPLSLISRMMAVAIGATIVLFLARQVIRDAYVIYKAGKEKDTKIPPM